MAIRLERTIWPVGHGAFYTEQFKNGDNVLFSVAYDCGSSDSNTISRQITDATVGGIIPIDMLFISHFHSDHINGLPTLLANHLVRQIVLPQLAEEVVLEAVVYNFIKASKGGYKAPSADVINLQTQLIIWAQGKSKDNVTEVLDSEEGKNIAPIEIGERKDEGGQTNSVVLPTEIHSGKEIPIATAGKIFWRYIPICYRDKQKCLELLEVFNNKYHIIDDKGKIDWTKVVNVLSDEKNFEGEQNSKGLIYKNVDAITQLYDSIFKKHGKEQAHNCYSMPVYSGPLCLIIGQDVNIWPYDYCWCWRLDVYKMYTRHTEHCLYTGDFEANDPHKIASIKTQLGQLWNEIELLQIPHHISDHNYNSHLYDKPILCFGNVADKKDKSFSITTLRDIACNDACFPVVVTEKDEPLVFVYSIEIC